MTGEPSQPTTSNRPGRGGDPIHTARMSFGDHLEELRSCLIRALMGVVLGMAVALLLGKEILEIVCRPLLAAQLAGGLPPRLQVLAPTAAFTAYLKIGLLSGLILSMPWVLAQGWRFVATGLYSHERRFAKLLVPSSLVLFAAGVLFLYFAVLPVLFQFFIRFNQGFDALVPAATRQLEPGAAAPSPATTAPSPDAASTSPSGNTTAPFRIPQHADPPPDARVGDLWLDPAT
ncbi:MAG: twin-arginine translocase subunit TatC, partial [Phycisphaerae bacterium]